MSPRCVMLLLPLASVLAIAWGWGSDAICDGFRPETDWLANFPSSPTVTVSNQGSFSKAIGQCDSLVGATGYCTIELQGNPGDSTLQITRSRVRITSSSGVVITSSGSVSLVAISTPGLSYISIEGLEIQGHAASEVFGIFVSSGNIQDVHIKGCKIHGFTVEYGNAHGIAVYGEGPEAIRDVTIDGNEVFDMKTGSSESVVINGFVRRWAIINNHVHDVNNIAIDAIGGEGTFPPDSSQGRILPSGNDAANYGFIENNLVERMSTVGNLEYGGERSWAAGIYVDGAHHIRIAGNTVRDTPWGIEIGGENCVTTEHIVVVNNNVSGSYYGDFVAGGYAEMGFLDFPSIGCDPYSTEDSDEGHGYVDRITVEENNFSTTDGTESNVLPQYRLRYAVIKQSGISPDNSGGDGSVSGDSNSIRTS